MFPSRSPELLRNSRLNVHSIRRHNKRRTQAMRMPAPRSVSVRVPGWNCPEMDWTTRVSGLSLKDWRSYYAEHNRYEQVLLHQELYGHALQVQQNPCSYPASVRQRLDEELREDNEYRSSYMMQALNYLDHFWDGICLYRKDGSYPIDNNLAERSVRPLPPKRKCSLHFDSDEGVEMSAVYHSVISTLKLCGKSDRNFFGDYFRCEVPGLDTYKEYLPALSK